MSATDPLAAISARVAAAESAMLEAAINLGVSAEILQAQISIGDILPAKILPPQNGQDLIEIAGQRVAAQLPPGVNPGETLLLQVTAFAGTQIYVRNLGTPDARNPLPVNQTVLNASGDEPPVQSATLKTIGIPEPDAPQQSQQAQQPQQPQQAQQALRTQPVSPPREVFVAASVRQAPAPPAPPVQTVPAAPPVHGVEARIAAAQTAKLPPIAARTAPPPAPPIVPQKNIVQRVAQTVSEFLRAARMPDTPFTRMAATIAPHAPDRLPSVLQRLETALPPQTHDERISTLRTLIGFTARLNPANAETLRTQISSFVSNVIEGAEKKVAQLLQAHTQADAPAKPQSQPVQDDPPPLSPSAAQARAAERAAAVSHDLKSVVLSLLRDPGPARTPALTQALSETLITLTGVQVNALSAQQQNPGTITLTLPVYYHEGGKPAHVRISRDAQSRGAKMDADNFHVAFVLDTANLGTVAVDLQTTGRTVKVDVKTEDTSAAHRFSDTLSGLRTRLEDLRYRVSSAVASALPSPAAAPAPTKKSAAVPAENKRGLDLQA
ncbi:MAG TPA: flagellar hook-length control protein FliK [Candidatus Baltobacteraceae bacterium]